MEPRLNTNWFQFPHSCTKLQLRRRLHDAAGCRCSAAVVKPHKRLNNRLDNRLNICIHDLSNRLNNRLNNRLHRVDIQPVVQPVLQPSDNRLYRLNADLTF